MCRRSSPKFFGRESGPCDAPTSLGPWWMKKQTFCWVCLPAQHPQSSSSSPPAVGLCLDRKGGISYQCTPHVARGFVCTGLKRCCRRSLYHGSRMGGKPQRRTKGNTTRYQTSQLDSPRLHSLLDFWVGGRCTKKYIQEVSLVIQWLRLRLPMQRWRFDPWSGSLVTKKPRHKTEAAL